MYISKRGFFFGGGGLLGGLNRAEIHPNNERVEMGLEEAKTLRV